MNSEKIKISIIMPSFNVKEFIEECIESVVNQTLRDIEIICVDAGSTDGTLEILDEYAKKDSRIKLFHSDKKSYGYQMNLGIDNANGEYIGIVETDDFIDERMYETLYELTDNATTDISKVNFYHFYDPSFKIDICKKNLPTKPFTPYDNADILRGHPSIWAAIYKKSFLKENNIKFMEAPGGGWVDNPFLFQTMLSAKSITYKDEPYYYYRELNPNSSTNDMKDLTLAMERMMNNLDVLEDFSCDNEDILNVLYVRIFWHIHDILKKDNFNQQRTEVLNYFYKVLSRLDEEIIKERFNVNVQKTYYKYLSPINIIDFENKESIDLSKEDYDKILKENTFLYNRILSLEKKNRKSTKKIKELEKSSSNKIGSLLKKPKKLFKN